MTKLIKVMIVIFSVMGCIMPIQVNAAINYGTKTFYGHETNEIIEMFRLLNLQNFDEVPINKTHVEEKINTLLYETKYKAFGGEVLPPEYRNSHNQWASNFNDGINNYKVYESLGCMLYANYVATMVYDKERGMNKKNIPGTAGQYGKEDVKQTILTYAQAGEHIRIGNGHSIAYLSGNESGFYYLEYFGEANPIYLRFTTWNHFTSAINQTSSTNPTFIFETNPSVNDISSNNTPTPTTYENIQLNNAVVNGADAKVSGTLTNTYGKSIVEIGLCISDNLFQIEPAISEDVYFTDSSMSIWYDSISTEWKQLEPNKQYYYKLYAIASDGTQFYSMIGAFKTGEDSSSSTPITYYNLTLNEPTVECYDASVSGTITNTYGKTVSELGLYIGTEANHLTHAITESVDLKYNKINMWYDSIGAEWQWLVPNTTYYYRLYGKASDGTMFMSEVDSFTTWGLNISGLTSSIPASSYQYTGSSIKPSVTILNGDYTLVEGKDYILNYTNNTNVGTAAITITGIGQYINTQNIDFQIVQKSITECTVTLTSDTYAYTSYAVKPAPKVMDGTKKLVLDTDYTVTYKNNINLGTATVTITGKGNYAGKLDKCFEIIEQTPEPSIIEVVRIKGKTRYQTSLEIADVLKEELNISKFDTVILANGRDFADALAGSYLAAVKDAPILMVDSKNNNMTEIITYLNANMNKSGKIYILGGEAAVPAFADDALAANGYSFERLKGKNRYGTNLAILAEAGVSNEPILVANAKNFADSLSASATGLPMLLVGSSLNADQKAFLDAHRGNPIYVLGGTGAVSAEVEEKLKAYGTVERVYGKSRYETSIEIAKKFFPDAETAVLAYAKNYPDGLCGGPLAYNMKAPLILTATGNNVAAAYTTSKGIKSGAVLGGDSLISDEAVKNAFGKAPTLK